MIPKLRVPPLIFFLLLCTGCGGAAAQTVGPDEAVGVTGGVIQKLSLTPAQKSAIYNSVVRQKLPASTRGIAAIVGSPVPPSVLLSDLPASAIIDGNEVGFLKYAMVEDDVVVVDPIEMRVVDVIHAGVIP